jgi:hypothetical protein
MIRTSLLVLTLLNEWKVVGGLPPGHLIGKCGKSLSEKYVGRGDSVEVERRLLFVVHANACKSKSPTMTATKLSSFALQACAPL